MSYQLVSAPTRYCFTSELKFCDVAHHHVFPNSTIVWKALEESSQFIAHGLEVAIQDALLKRERDVLDGWCREENQHETRITLNIEHEDLLCQKLSCNMLNASGNIMTGERLGSLIALALSTVEDQRCLSLRKVFSLEFVFREDVLLPNVDV